MKSSTGLPAFMSIITRRGRLRLATISGMERAPIFCAGCFVGHKFINLGGGTVVGHDGEAVVVHV